MGISNDQLNAPPSDLPVPADDGAADHLVGMEVPSLPLIATDGQKVDLSTLGRAVIFAYPRTSQPGTELLPGWDDIPGARGCTPQNCSFRDHYQELKEKGVEIYGLSTQDTDYQKEVVERLHLPFSILSDEDYALTEALRLPTFEVQDLRLLKRLTFIVNKGKIEHIFYPVFPSDKNVFEVLAYLS